MASCWSTLSWSHALDRTRLWPVGRMSLSCAIPWLASSPILHTVSVLLSPSSPSSLSAHIGPASWCLACPVGHLPNLLSRQAVSRPCLTLVRRLSPPVPGTAFPELSPPTRLASSSPARWLLCLLVPLISRGHVSGHFVPSPLLWASQAYHCDSLSVLLLLLEAPSSSSLVSAASSCQSTLV